MRRFAVFIILLIPGRAVAAPANVQWEESRRSGAAAREQGRYSDARRWFETALAQAAFDPADLRRADLDDELAGICQLLGDEAAAEGLYADAVRILDQHPHDGVEVRSVVLGGLGLYRARQGRLSEANDVLEKALAAATLTFGERDLRTASLQSSLGQIYVMEGKLTNAESLLQSAIKVEQNGPPSSAPERVVSETTLGVAYMTEGRYPEAEAILRSATEEAAELGESYPAYAGALAQLADLYRLEGKSARGEPLLKKAQAIYEAAFGSDSPRAAEILLDRSVDSLAAKKTSLAESQIRSALEVLRKKDGPEHPSVALGEFRLAQAFVQQGRYADAEPLLQHALAVQEKAYPGGDYMVADTLLQLAEVERMQRRYADSELCYRRAIPLFDNAGGPGSYGLALALKQYAKLLRTNRTEEAKSLEKRAEGLQKSVQAFK